MLVLLDKLDDKPLYEWQDRLEQKCKQLSCVTAIVLETAKFSEGLLRGDRFSRKILQNSPLIYNSSNFLFDLPKEFDQDETNKAIEKLYQDGLKTAQEFIVGADLFRIRSQNKLAAFLLHQAAEQCLRALLREDKRYTESDLENAIINKIEHFMLDLGKGFLFEGRQKRFTFDGDNFYVDLVLYNRLLKAFVLAVLYTAAPPKKGVFLSSTHFTA